MGGGGFGKWQAPREGGELIAFHQVKGAGRGQEMKLRRVKATASRDTFETIDARDND